MAQIKILYDFEISPADYGLFNGHARRLSNQEFTGKTALTGSMSYAIFLCTEDEIKVICIKLQTNFITTPRIYGMNDGYGESGIAQGDGSLAYPLDDTTDTSAILAIETDTVEWSRGSRLYGNVDWKGKSTSAEGEPSDAPVLTWKGPVGRTIPFDPDTFVSGFTTPDIKFGEGADKWTCFGPNIYQSGEILETLPTVGDVEPKVLGCAITEYEKDGNKFTALVAIVNNHYADKTGFFEEVWVNVTSWVKINSVEAGRPTQCWFFNESGNKCTQGVSEYTLDLANNTATLDRGTNTFLSTKYEVTSTQHKVTYSGSTKVWSDYKGDVRVFAEVSASGGHVFNGETNTSGTTTAVPVYLSGEGTSSNVWITGPQTASVGAQYDLEGTLGSCASGATVWTFTGGTISGSGAILTVTGCGIQQVMAKVGSVSASFPVRTSGVWKVVGTSHAACTGINLPGGAPCSSDPCGGHFTINTTCAIRWWDGSGYLLVTEESSTTKVESLWGVFEGAVGTVTTINDSGSGSGTTAAPDDPTPGFIAASTQNTTSEWWCNSTTRGGSWS